VLVTCDHPLIPLCHSVLQLLSLFGFGPFNEWASVEADAEEPPLLLLSVWAAVVLGLCYAAFRTLSSVSGPCGLQLMGQGGTQYAALRKVSEEACAAGQLPRPLVDWHRGNMLNSASKLAVDVVGA
jgi:hypothetical protein